MKAENHRTGATRRVLLHDMSLRDGMHSQKHQFAIDQMVSLACALDEAKVPLIEISHGDGLAGSSINYGFAKHSDEDYLRAVIPKLKTSKVSALLLPGIGTTDDLAMAASCGVAAVRVATHCTEADISEQHLNRARAEGLDAIGFLMMSHMVTAEELVGQARLLQEFGACCVYVTDSAGYMLPDEVKHKVYALRSELRGDIEIGFHGHNNLSMSVANSLAAIEAGASRIDGSVAGFGAGAGNTPLEVFAAVCQRLQIATGVDLDKLVDAAQDVALPMMESPPRIDRESLALGFAGVYSSFLLHAKRAEQVYGVSAREILMELGRRKTVGGQEDMIEDVALDLARKRHDPVSV